MEIKKTRDSWRLKFTLKEREREGKVIKKRGGGKDMKKRMTSRQSIAKMNILITDCSIHTIILLKKGPRDTHF